MKHMCAVEFEIQENQAIEIEVDSVTVVRVGDGNAEIYKGEYSVIPKFTPQTLHTAEKILIEDVAVQKIPVTVTANTAGGNTIIIGG